MKAVQSRPGFKGFVYSLVQRNKLSRGGKEAREELTIDRSHPNKTVKKHRVDELEDGRWVNKHDHGRVPDKASIQSVTAFNVMLPDHEASQR